MCFSIQLKIVPNSEVLANDGNLALPVYVRGNGQGYEQASRLPVRDLLQEWVHNGHAFRAAAESALLHTEGDR